MKRKPEETYSSVHNYLEETEEGIILRKGAISAKAGEPVVIPVNIFLAPRASHTRCAGICAPNL